MRLGYRGGLSGFQGAGVERVNWGQGIGKGGPVGRVGHSEGEELEGLDAGYGDDVIVACLGFGVCGGRVDGNEVRDGTGCEERAFSSYSGLRGGNADAGPSVIIQGLLDARIPCPNCAAQCHFQRHHSGGHSDVIALIASEPTQQVASIYLRDFHRRRQTGESSS